jgi:hypothetical protein
VVTRGIREFVSRDWAAVRDSKDDYWARRIEALGPAEAFRIADELRRQALFHEPHWPSAETRRLDLECHARVAALLCRADWREYGWTDAR